MAATGRRHFLYILFLLVMALVFAAGVALVIYGVVNNGFSAPKLPGVAPLISLVPHG